MEAILDNSVISQKWFKHTRVLFIVLVLISAAYALALKVSSSQPLLLNQAASLVGLYVFGAITVIPWMRALILIVWCIVLLVSMLSTYTSFFAALICIPIGLKYIYEFFKSNYKWEEKIGWNTEGELAIYDAKMLTLWIAIATSMVAVFSTPLAIIDAAFWFLLVYLIPKHKRVGLVLSVFLFVYEKIYQILNGGDGFIKNDFSGWAVTFLVAVAALYVYFRALKVAFMKKDVPLVMDEEVGGGEVETMSDNRPVTVKKMVAREGLIILGILGLSAICFAADFSNAGGLILVFLYPGYLIVRFVIWAVKTLRN